MMNAADKLHERFFPATAPFSAKALKTMLDRETGQTASVDKVEELDLDGDGATDAAFITYRLLETDSHASSLYEQRDGSYRMLLADGWTRNLKLIRDRKASYVVLWALEGSGGYLSLDIYRHDPLRGLIQVDLDALAQPARNFDELLESVGASHAEPRFEKGGLLLAGAGSSLVFTVEDGLLKLGRESPVAGAVGFGVRKLRVDDRAPGPHPAIEYDGQPVELVPREGPDGVYFENSRPLRLRSGERLQMTPLAESARWERSGFSDDATKADSVLVAGGRGEAVIDLTTNWYTGPRHIRLRFEIF
ncbi:hypothetical protein L6Q21_04955 [Sandaracinobacter sp. RS1-74]|nr:hypothetical protein [Sandaracinobacteroides sayramensis]